MKLVDRGLSRDQRCTRYEGTPLSREKLGRQSEEPTIDEETDDTSAARS